MRILRACVMTMARFCLSAVFLAGAMKNILNWHDTETSVIGMLFDWQGYVGFSEDLQAILAFITPFASVLLLIATLLMLSGGLFVLLGYKEKLGASLLVLFLIPATLFYHPFWIVEGTARELQAVMFLKNLAIFGSLLFFLLQSSEKRSKQESTQMQFQ